MPLDSNSLDSLKIDRSARPAARSRGFPWMWVGLVLLLAGGGVAWVLLREQPVVVEIATATTAPSAASRGAAVLDASGYVVARREATVSSKVTGKVAEVMIEEGM